MNKADVENLLNEARNALDNTMSYDPRTGREIKSDAEAWSRALLRVVVLGYVATGRVGQIRDVLRECGVSEDGEVQG